MPLELYIGGERMEPSKRLYEYGVVQHSVIHPHWEQSLPVADSLVSWLDPDWWIESKRQNDRKMKDLCNNIRRTPHVTLRNMVWPGPLVYPNGINEPKPTRPNAGGQAVDAGGNVTGS